MKFYLNGEKISKKEAQLLCGKRFVTLVKIAHQDLRIDPNTELSFMVDGGMLTIEI